MNVPHLAVLTGTAALLLAGCGPKFDQQTLEKKVAEDWRQCERVKPEQIRIEEKTKTTVRYSFVLKVVVDGSSTGYTCFTPNAKMLEALANKSLLQMKAGEEIPVTQEITLK